jgi:hypothetical protein
MRQRRFVPIFLFALVCLGCSGDGLTRVSVKGKVLAAGEPVSNATVLFMPADETKGEGAIGTTDKEGNFTLVGSRQGDKGIVPGKYRVRVSRFMDRDGTILPADIKEADHPHARESIPAPYSSADSPLEVTIPEKGGEVRVEIPVKAMGKN